MSGEQERGRRGIGAWVASPGLSRGAKVAAGLVSAAASIVAIVVAVTQLGGDSAATADTVPAQIRADLSQVVDTPATRREYEERLRASPPAASPIPADELPAAVRRVLGLSAMRPSALAKPAGTVTGSQVGGIPLPPPESRGRVIDFVVTLDGLTGRRAYVTAEVLPAAAEENVHRQPAAEVLILGSEATSDRLSSNLFVTVPEGAEPVIARLSVYDDEGTRLTFADSEEFTP